MPPASTPRTLPAIALLLLSGACARDAPAPAPQTPKPAEAKTEPRVIAPALPIPVEVPSEPGEDGVRDFVTTFMDVRLTGDDECARDFLSSTALEQYAAPEEILPLTSMSFTGWELVSLEAADANAWEARVRIRREDDQVEEVLFVGPGADGGGTQRTWIVRGVAQP